MVLNSFGCVCLLVQIYSILCDYTVTIYPEYLAQNERTHFEADRWDGHGGLDSPGQIAGNKVIGTESGRWMNRDLNEQVFQKTPENSHHRGYPDPNHLNHADLSGKYIQNLNGYGHDLDTVMVIKGTYWPHWMDTSHHGGIFPNNLDAGAEMISLMFGAIQHQTGGTIPPYFEVMNEPDTLWKHVPWSTIIDFHRIVAQKLKAKFSHLKVGGPTYTGAIGASDKQNFRVWKMVAEFMDMSLDHLDFFSLHAYSSFHVQGGSHHFGGINEARLVAVIDLIESYAHHKKGHGVPLITSEFGLGSITGINSHVPNALVEWAYAYLHNAHMFTYLNFRGVMERVVAFLLSHDSPTFINDSIFNRDGSETHVAKAYRFWHHFNYNHQFLRVESQFDGAERKVSPLVLVDPHSKQVSVLLHNYGTSQARVKLNFDKNWIHVSSGHSTCLYLNSQKVAILTNGEQVHLSGNVVTVPAESSCFFVFGSSYNFGTVPTVHEDTYYANDMASTIHNNVYQTTVNLPSVGHVGFAYLRVGVSMGHGTATKPTAVHVNGHAVTSHFLLYDADRQTGETSWDVYMYQVPGNILKQHGNTVKLDFHQSSGHVSTAALVVGRLSGGPGPIG